LLTAYVLLFMEMYVREPLRHEVYADSGSLRQI